MKYAMVSYDCDGPDCDATIAGDEFWPPDQWFVVMPPGEEQTHEPELHFCTAVCLSVWAGSMALTNVDP